MQLIPVFILPCILSVAADKCISSEIGSAGTCQGDDELTMMQLRRDLNIEKVQTSSSVGASSLEQCSKDTGATCQWADCKEGRNATCVEGKCLCAGEDSCAWDGYCYSRAAYSCLGRTEGSFGPPHTVDKNAEDVHARFWVSQNALDYLGKTLVDFLINSVTSVRFPEIDGNTNGIHYHLGRIRVDAAAGAQASFVKDNGIRVVIQNIDIDVKTEFKAEFGIFWTQGTVKASTSRKKTSISATVVTDVSSDGYPVVWLEDVDTDAAFEHITFTGTTLSGVGNVLTWLFQDVFDDVFTGLLDTAVKEIMCGPVTRILQKWDTIQELPFPAPYDVVAIDIGLHKISVDTDHIDLMVNGNVVDISDTNLVYPVPPAPLPTPAKVTTSMVSLAATQTILNSILWIFHQKNLLHFPARDEDYPEETEVRLSTTSLGWFVPGLWQYKNKTILVDVYPEKAPKVDLIDGEIRTNVDVILDFYVDLDDSKDFVFSLKTGLDAALGIEVKQPLQMELSDNSSILFDGDDEPKCKRHTGDTCYIMQCSSHQNSVCYWNDCKCRKGACFDEDEGVCIETPTTTPAPPPTPPPPPLQKVKFNFKELDVKQFKVMKSKVGIINNLMLNWALSTFMPFFEKMVNKVFDHYPLVINASESPIQPDETSLSFTGGSVKIFSDFFLASKWLYLGELITGLLEEKVNELIYKKIR